MPVWMMLPLWLVGSAHADIAPVAPAGRQFTQHAVEVTGLPAGKVLVFGDAERMRGYAVARADRKLVLGEGGRRLGAAMTKPSVWAMSTAAAEAWMKRAEAVAEEQAKACEDRGEGCAHISRFRPTYPTPSEGIDCGLRIPLQLEGPSPGPSKVVQPLHVEALTAEKCVVKLGPLPPPPSSSLCGVSGVVTGGASVLVGLGLALSVVRRREDDGAPSEPGPCTHE